jgi:hypothetical protein
VNSITTRRNPMVDLDRHYSWIVRLPVALAIKAEVRLFTN